MNLRHNVTANGHMSHDPSNIMTCERNVAVSLVNEMCCNLRYQLCIFKRNTPMGFNWCFDCVDKEKNWFVFTFSIVPGFSPVICGRSGDMHFHACQHGVLFTKGS